MGLTPKEVGRLAKRHPDLINDIGGGHVRRLVDLFLDDLEVGKVIFNLQRRSVTGGGWGGHGLLSSPPLL